MWETNPNKFLSRLHPSFILMTRRGVLELLDSVCCVEEDTVSLTSFSAAAFLSFAYLHPYILLHVVWADVPCFLLVVDEAAGLKFFGHLGNNPQTSWWQNRHFHHSWLISQRGGQTSNSHAYRQILFLSCCSHWLGYVSVCELDVIANISVDALLANELVSHFWDIETAQWCCRCLHGIADLFVSYLFCAFYCCCVLWMKRNFSFFSFCFSWMNRLSDKW